MPAGIVTTGIAMLIAVWRSPTTRADPDPSSRVHARPTCRIQTLTLTSVLATRNLRYRPMRRSASSEASELIARVGSRSVDPRAIVGARRRIEHGTGGDMRVTDEAIVHQNR